MKRVTVNNETYNSPQHDYYWLDAETYFDIQDNINLGGDTLYGVKENSIFAFHGGSFSNGTIYGILNVEAGAYQVFQSNVDLNNSELKIKAPYILPEWFGAGTGTDDYAALKLAFDIAARSSQIVRLTGQYSLGNNTEPLVVDKNCTLLFAGGSLRNGILGGYINLKTESNDIFGSNLTFAEGTELNVPYLRPEWFGAKGDYNPDTHTGTDDTAAISRAVRTAEILSIKTVKFNAVNYLVSGNGIMIYRGNIILEGSGAMLKESQTRSIATRRYKTKEGKTSIIEDEGSTIGKEAKYTLKDGQGQESDVDTFTITKTSTIYCKNGETCVTCYRGNEYEINLLDKKDSEPSDADPTKEVEVKYINKQFVRSGVSDSIYIKDLQFICDINAKTTTNQTGKNAIGIAFNGTFYGPAWPVIIERCYFKWFDKAFLIDSAYVGADGFAHTLQYCIHCLTFRDNAFWQNTWCVYAEECEYVTKNPEIHLTLYEGPWAFEFVDNRCHQNDFLIRICVQKGLCLIENNNTEGTFGDCPDDNPTYAIDVQLAQRAVARICHNHFESNRTRLVKVVGYLGNECRVVVAETNTDGMDDKLNKCYFANVTLETDQNAIIKNCLIENKLPCEKTLILDDITELSDEGKKLFNYAFLRHRGNKLIENVPFKLVDNEAHGGTVMRVTTPYGQRWMTCSYKTSANGTEDGDIILDTDVYTNQDAALVASNRYLNIEIPYYKEGKEGRLNYIRLTLSEPGTNTDVNLPQYTNSINSISSNRSGFYWMRLQINLEQDFLNGLHVQAHTFPAWRNLSKDSCLYFGAATYVLSSEPLDLNMPLNPHDFDIKPLKNADGVCFFREGERFVIDNFEVTCLQTGYIGTSHEFYPCNDGNENIVISKPILIGTTWEFGFLSFQVCNLADTTSVYENGSSTIVDEDGNTQEKGEYLKYYIRILKGTYSLFNNDEYNQHSFDCIKPILLGRGRGAGNDKDADIKNYLCDGSTFYDEVTGKTYVLYLKNWKEL